MLLGVKRSLQVQLVEPASTRHLKLAVRTHYVGAGVWYFKYGDGVLIVRTSA